MLREHPDQRRKKCAHATAEVVAEALPRAAQTRRIELGEKRTDTGKITAAEEAERKAEPQHHAVTDRELRISEHRDDRDNRERNEQCLAPEAVGNPRTGQITANAAYNQKAQIAGRIDHAQMALGL